jgi:cystathionine gamma-synthase
MTHFPHRPLGQRIPKSLHAVSCSLPKMQDVIGYEEKDAETLTHICSGYPRFVVHSLLESIQKNWADRFDLADQTIWLTSSIHIAQDLKTYLHPEPSHIIEKEGLCALVHSINPDLYLKARSFLQHTGGFLSSRQAEDYLLAIKSLEVPQAEETVTSDAEAKIKNVLARIYGIQNLDDILLTSSGMNAIYSTFKTISAHQRKQGRSIWIQLGWLYLDTMEILRKCTDNESDHKILLNVFDLEALDKLLVECGDQLAGMITEAPTNPLVQTPDFEEVASRVRRSGGLMVVDPSTVSPLNVDILPHSDIIVNSLTKYAANEGDVIAGAIIITPHCPEQISLRESLRHSIEPLYSRDQARLAFEIDDYEKIIPIINTSTAKVVEFLQNHPGIRKVYWPFEAKSANNFHKIARSPNAIGSIITFELTGKLSDFYDKVSLAKGPSFGMKTSILCPFMYLAHYNLVSIPEGRANLFKEGLDPDLIRLSIGVEPVEALIEALGDALS